MVFVVVEWLKHPDTERLSNLLGFSSPDMKLPSSDELSSSDSESEFCESLPEDHLSSKDDREGSDEQCEVEDRKTAAHREKKSQKPLVTKNPFELLADDD